MLVELRVSTLGVIEEASIVLGPGMIAVTGETGAGKTLVVTAIELLVGGRADAGIVRPGATEAVVEGRFVSDDGECVVRRVIPAKGRSRGYIDGSGFLIDLARRSFLAYVGRVENSDPVTREENVVESGCCEEDRQLTFPRGAPDLIDRLFTHSVVHGRKDIVQQDAYLGLRQCFVEIGHGRLTRRPVSPAAVDQSSEEGVMGRIGAEQRWAGGFH